MRNKLRVCLIRILLLIISVSALILVHPKHVSTVLAQYTWTDTLAVYPSITTVLEPIRTITNNYDYPIDVKCSLIDANGITYLSLFKVSGNGTNFVLIKNGTTVIPYNLYAGLNPGETLYFSITVKPVSTLNVNQTITVQERIELYRSTSAPAPLPPISPPSFPSRLDLIITSVPRTIYVPSLSPTFSATLTIVNPQYAGVDVTVKWWLTDPQGNIVDEGEQTIYVPPQQQKQVSIQLLTPTAPGTYTLNAETTKPVIVSAKTTITIKTIPLQLIISIAFVFLTLLALARANRKS